MSVCANPARGQHKLKQRSRRISLIRIDWGNADLREKWEGKYEFCSFACLAEWATEKADQHDDRVLVEGH